MGDVEASAPRSSFVRYWSAAAISAFGSAVTTVAMPVLVVHQLRARSMAESVVSVST